MSISIRTIHRPGEALSATARAVLLEDIVALNMLLSDSEMFKNNWHERSAALLDVTDELVLAYDGPTLVGHCSTIRRSIAGIEVAYVDTFTVHPRLHRSGLGFPMTLRMAWRLVRRARGLRFFVVARTESESLLGAVRRTLGPKSFYPSFQPGRRSAPELERVAVEIAASLWPERPFSAETGVVEGAYGGRFLPETRSGDPLVRAHFDRHVDHDRGDAVVLVMWFRPQTWWTLLHQGARRMTHRRRADRRCPMIPARLTAACGPRHPPPQMRSSTHGPPPSRPSLMPKKKTTTVRLRLILIGIGALGASACLGETPPLGGGTSDSSSSGGTTGSSSGVAPDSSGGPEQTPACVEYLECLAQDEPALVPAAEAEYGPTGTCWSDAASAEQCDATCQSETEQRCLGGSGDGTGGEVLACSIEGLVPGTRSPVEAGDSPMLLPVPIGALLERNCGCHYLDAMRLDPEVPAYNGAMRMATWEDFHTPFMGTPTYLRVQQRSVVELSMPPPFFCDSLDLGSLSTEDHALLGAWLDAGAPDAVRWGG